MLTIYSFDIVDEPMLRIPIDEAKYCDHQIGLLDNWLIPASSYFRKQYGYNSNVEWFKYCPKCGQSLHNINGLEVQHVV